MVEQSVGYLVVLVLWTESTLACEKHDEGTSLTVATPCKMMFHSNKETNITRCRGWRIGRVVEKETQVFSAGNPSQSHVCVASLCRKGVIANGSNPEKCLSVAKYGYNMSSVWSFVDTAETFRVFVAVQRFTKRDDIDAILLFDWNSHLHQDDLIFTEGSKKLIVFDNRNESKNTEEQDNVSSEAAKCEETYRTTSHGRVHPYCEIDINGASESITSRAMASSVGTRALSQLIVDSLHWQQVYILHENATDKETRNLVDALSLKGVLVTIYNMDTTQDFLATLAQIYHSTILVKPEINFVVICRSRCVRNIFRIANRFDSHQTGHTTMLNQFSRWLVAEYGHTGDLAHAKCIHEYDPDNVVIVAIPDVIAPSSRDVTDILDAVLIDLYVKDVDNSTIADHTTKRFITDLITKKATTWHLSARCTGYKIDTLVRTTKGRELNTVGSVDARGHLSLQSDLFPNLKYGFNKRQFIVATLPWDPFVNKHNKTLKDEKTGEPTGNVTVRYGGLTMDLLKELARVLNFTYVIVEPADQKWGGLDIAENLTYNGLIGLAQRRECDFVAAPSSIQPLRNKVVDFSDTYYFEYTTAIVKKIDPRTVKWRTLVDPLKWEVLLSIGVGLGIVTLLLYLLEKNNPFYNNRGQNRVTNTNGGLHYLHDSFWYMYGCLLYQGGVHLPDSTAGRTLVSSWWLTCIVIVGIYCGNLIAFLTVTKETPPFKTLDEMVKNTDYKYGTIGGTSGETLLMNSSIPTFKRIGDGMREFLKTDPGVLNIGLNYHLDRVRNGGYAWIGDKTAIEVTIANECDLTNIKEEFLPMKYALVFPKNSPLRFLLSQQILGFRERGLIQIWKKKWWPKSNFCAPSKAYEAKPISLIDVQSAFYICVIGTCVGVIAFVVEHIVYRVRRYRTNAPSGDAENTVTSTAPDTNDTRTI